MFIGEAPAAPVSASGGGAFPRVSFWGGGRSAGGQGSEQVAPADDADGLELIVDNRNARNTMCKQQADGFGDFGLRTQCDRMPAHDLVYPLVQGGEISGGFRRAAYIRAQRSEKVAIRDDAAQLL